MRRGGVSGFVLNDLNILLLNPASGRPNLSHGSDVALGRNSDSLIPFWMEEVPTLRN